MAEIAHGHVEDLTNQIDVSGFWFTALTAPAANFVAGGKYLLLVTGQVTGSRVTDVYSFRVLHDVTEFAGSRMELTPRSATWGTYRYPYTYMTVFDQPGGGAEDIHFQMITSFATAAAMTDTTQIFYMRLDADLVDGTDYKFAEDDDMGAPVAHTGTPANFASITFTPAVGAEDWLIIGNSLHEIQSTTKQGLYRINYDAGTDDAPECSLEGKQAGNNIAQALIRTYTLTAAAHTFTMQGYDSALGAPQNDHLRTAIFALRLNAFADHAFVWNEADYAYTNHSVWEEIGNIDLTVTNAADFLTLAAVVGDPSGVGHTNRERIQVGGVTHPTGSGDYADAGAHDALDTMNFIQMLLQNWGVGAVDIDQDGQTNNLGVRAEDRSLTTFSMELAGGGPPPSTEGYGTAMSSIGC